MSSSLIKDILDVPRDFVQDGHNFVNRCTKPDKREFLRISQAVGVGFVAMGVIGYIVKLKIYTSEDWRGDNQDLIADLNTTSSTYTGEQRSGWWSID